MLDSDYMGRDMHCSNSPSNCWVHPNAQFSVGSQGCSWCHSADIKRDHHPRMISVRSGYLHSTPFVDFGSPSDSMEATTLCRRSDKCMSQ